ncbi:MAG: ribosomal protein S18-alanine N-acetyltransferase [Gammaproteobacteria bacterium]|nr:ribosomal protein S18-alanine N-acetyltransferase [Gammaproteobacteria bacterium]
MRALTLRRLEAEHVADLLAVERLSYTHPWTEGNFLGCFNPDHEVWGAFLNDRLVGYGILLKQWDEVHLLNVCVAPKYRNAGVGGQLIEHLILRAQKMGGQSLWLEVRASNHAAQSLYRRYGFVEQGRRRGYYPVAGGREDAILMALPLDVDTAAEEAGWNPFAQ